MLNNINTLLKEYITNIDKKNKPVENNQNKINALKRKISRLKELYIEELIDIETYKKDYTQFKKELAELTPQSKIKAPDTILSLVDVDIEKMYKQLSREDKQAFWQGIIKEIHIIDQEAEKYEIFFN